MPQFDKSDSQEKCMLSQCLTSRNWETASKHRALVSAVRYGLWSKHTRFHRLLTTTSCRALPLQTRKQAGPPGQWQVALRQLRSAFDPSSLLCSWDQSMPSGQWEVKILFKFFIIYVIFRENLKLGITQNTWSVWEAQQIFWLPSHRTTDMGNTLVFSYSHPVINN